MHLPTQPLMAPAASAVSFSGERPVFRQLVVRGGLLELLTLGFYRFWLATDIRRHLWSHSSVDGDPAEYTGRARELLIGFLIALAILVPIYLAYFLVGLEAERLQAFASVPLALFLYLFSEFARYRARRYRVTRTVWRGLRFSMGGSGWSYSWRAGLWTLLTFASLGLALPWRQAALERYKMRHTAYGNLEGRFVGTGGAFFKQAWYLWLLALPAAALVIPLPFLYAAFKAIEWRWWVSNIRFGEVRFESRLETGALIGTYWKVVGWSLLLALVLAAWGALAFNLGSALAPPIGTAQQRALATMQHPVFLLGLGLGYLIVAIAFGAVMRLYLNRDVWARIAGTTVVLNLAAAENVTGQGMAADALGEGFADSLDIAGF